MQNKLKVIFATIQFDTVNSGPGTFTKYVDENFGDSNIEFEFVSEDIQKPAPQRHGVELGRLPWMRSSFLKGMAYRKVVRSLMSEVNSNIAIYNTRPTVSYYHATRSRPEEKLVLFISDANNLSPINRGEGIKGLITRFKQHISFRMERRALRRADLVVTNSRYLSSLVEDVYGVPSEKIRLLYKAVDLKTFAPFKRDKLASPVRILFVKSDYLTGGLQDLIVALQSVGFEYTLSIVGPQPAQHPKIKSLCTADQLEKVRLPGQISRDEMSRVFQDHDLLCVPSHREAFGVVLLESMASGLPTVGSNVGGIPEVLDNGRAGWLSPSQDPKALAAVLGQVVSDASERTKRVDHGIQHVQKFSIENMKSTFTDIVKEVTSQT